MRISNRSLKWIAVGTAAVLVIALVPAIAVSQGWGGHGRGHSFGKGMGRGHGGHGMMGRLMHELDLTEEQQAQIKGIMKSNREAMKADREAMREAKQKVRELGRADEFNEQAIREAARAAAALGEELAVKRARLHHEIMQVLSEEQRAKAQELREQRKERMRERMESRLERMGDRQDLTTEQ